MIFCRISGGTAGYLFAADRATTEFENRELGYADEEMLSAIERSRSIPDENLSKTDKALRYLNDNRWSVIGGSWALSMVGALGYSFSNKYLSKQQKLVQARMYAQAVTIAVLMASAGLSMYVGDDEKKTRELPDAQLRAVLEMPDTPQNHLHQQEPKKVHQ
ncbi:uncharacterized protein BYT42DRAFT_506189 [Radiomyces spectabilis]|uniref:uncharacterized protein n=1 Tax=Radiomyces spectabilis TaxID=64574 RepID=UPI00221FC69D|nr:uncharacterized protein BYT42DRAFT_506189 [Radiomyces spectabilis]KAI8364773.1 hypothetical protein BYT42DRAFT_506189 [Radiomyces spectabilis]